MKQHLRQLIRSRKASYSPDELETMSYDIIKTLQSCPLYQQAKTILLYHSLPDEVCTHKLIDEACKDKRVLLPTVVGDDIELHLYTQTSSLHSGAFNIIESEDELFTNYMSIDLAIIPGMAFDSEGNRLGRGKGYYDRLLPRITCPTIGLCFPFQLLDYIPHEKHDCKVSFVITKR